MPSPGRTETKAPACPPSRSPESEMTPSQFLVSSSDSRDDGSNCWDVDDSSNDGCGSCCCFWKLLPVAWDAILLVKDAMTALE